jgi:hypothetical protein
MNMVKALRRGHDIRGKGQHIFGICTIPKHSGSSIDDIPGRYIRYTFAYLLDHT